MSKFDDLTKYKLVEEEYKHAYSDLKDAYSIIQNRISIVVAAYAFIFSSYLGALSQWDDFRQGLLMILVLFVTSLLFFSFLPLIPASFLTVLMKWNSFGNPQGTIKKLKMSENLTDYYALKLDDWKESTKTNKRINATVNKLIILTMVLLLLTVCAIFAQVLFTLLFYELCQN